MTKTSPTGRLSPAIGHLPPPPMHSTNLVGIATGLLASTAFNAHPLPLVKILFYNDLLARHPLKGEAECLVIGGEYEVSAAYV